LTVARTSRRLKLRSEASARFEKGCDWAGIDHAVARFCELLAPCGAAASGAGVDVGGELPLRHPVRLRPARVNQLLGTELSSGQIAGYLNAIGFTSTPAGDDPDGTSVVEVVLPSWRLDSATEIDVVEEVARLHSYQAIPRSLPRSPLTGGFTPYQRDRRMVRQILAGAGGDEAWSTTFVSPADLTRCGLDLGEAVVVANPLVAEESRLRPSLLPGLLGALSGNARHRLSDVSLFEIGHTFRQPPAGRQLPEEAEMAAYAAAGADAGEAVTVWHLLVEGLGLADWRLEATATAGLHPTRTAAVVVDGAAIGALGEVDPDVVAAHELSGRVAWLEIDLGQLLGAAHYEAPYRPVSRFPSSDVDLAFEVDEATPAAAVERTLRQARDGLVAAVTLFDVYRGDQVTPGRRSLAWTVRFQAPDRTLTDEEVAEARRRLIEAVVSDHPAALRT
jgi:phenylalanyl-tRNA synthetase beta chain